MRLLTIALLATASAAALAQPPKACTGPEHRQFDFWIGEWGVTHPAGRNAGDNTIYPILGGCAISENWHGSAGGRGYSYSAYDRDRQVWHQTWVDEQGNLLLLEGQFTAGQMVLSGTQGKQLHRVTWEARKDGTVRQHWEASEDEGRNWKTQFDGLYRKKK